MFLIKLAVDIETADMALGMLLNKDAVVVLVADLVTAIAFLMLVTVASVTDKRIR
jgi:hypothetical protein